jgi:hypothetical protein
LCINCNKLEVKQTFIINNRGYNSIFDLDEVIIPLCNDCIKKLGIKKEWFTEKPNKQGEYTYESEVENLILNQHWENVVNNIV